MIKTNRKKHKCAEAITCCCYMLALEPDDNCPVHGCPWPPRCQECGRFMKREANEQTLLE